MRRIATWILVGAVAALGVAAAVDATRGSERRGPQEARVAAVPGLADQPALARRQLREAGVTGTLTYADSACRLHAVTLPELEAARAPSYRMCRPATATGGLGAVRGDVVWAGLGYGFQQVVLSRQELTRVVTEALGYPPEARSQVAVRALQATALDDERYVVLAESEVERTRFVAGFDGDRMRFFQPEWFVGDARALRPSPAGGYYALFGDGPRGLRVFTREGFEVDLPTGISNALTVAWSPDERWTAVATANSVYVFPSRRPAERVVRIPLRVHDLAWGA